jgi:hypothetical protein
VVNLLATLAAVALAMTCSVPAAETDLARQADEAGAAPASRTPALIVERPV